LIRPGSQSRLIPQEGIGIIEADLSNPEELQSALSNLDVDVIVHTAAIRNRWGTSSEEYYAVNVAATNALLDAVIGKTKRFVYVSSVGVFGRPGVLNIDETYPVDVSSSWDYHSTKAESEKAILAHSHQIEAVVVRPTITYGPGDNDGMVTKLIQMIKSRRFIRIGRGENHIHLTYIDDIVAGLLLAMTHPKAVGEIFILASQKPTTLASLLEIIEKEIGLKLPQWHIPQGSARSAGAICEELFKILPAGWSPPITRDKVDNLCVNRGFSWKKASSKLGYQPQHSLKEGLTRTMDWLSTIKIGTH